MLLRWLVIAVLLVGGVGCSDAPTVDEATASTVERLTLGAFAESRPTEGRLFGIPHAELAPEASLSDELNRAQLLFLTLPPTLPGRGLLQAYLDIGTYRWRSAAALLERHKLTNPDDVRVLNDLGVVYLELGKQDASYIHEALKLFQSALRLAETAAEPHFNRALAYHRLSLPEQREGAVNHYLDLDPDVRSVDELTELTQPSWEATLQRDETLSSALASNDRDQAWQLAEESPDSWWRLLTARALSGASAIADYEAMSEVAARFEQRFDDRTGTAMLAALGSAEGDAIRSTRSQLHDGLAALEAENYAVSLEKIEAVSRNGFGLNSEFDDNWTALALARALIWNGRMTEAKPWLDSLVERARQNGHRWILARALSLYATSHRLSRDRLEMIDRLRESIGLFDAVGAMTDSLRTRFYLAGHLSREGNSAASINIANRALRSVPRNDHGLFAQLYWILGAALADAEDAELALLYYGEAVRHASLAGNAIGATQLHIETAEIHESGSEQDLADNHVSLAEVAAKQVEPSSFASTIANMTVALGKAKILAGRGNRKEAATLLRQSLPNLDRANVDTVYRIQYRLTLARIYRDQGDVQRAQDEFALALEAVEYEDDMLAPPARLTFDEQRRSVYEDMIAFEFDQGHIDLAWEYAQRYRSKLLTEMLGQYAPGDDGFEERVSIATRRTRSAEGVPVLEYTMLEDRLLIWVSTSEGRTVRDYPMSRPVLTDKIGRFVELLRDESDRSEIRTLAEELHETLVAPVGDLITGFQHVSIVPDRILNRLPFDALVCPEGQYLVEEHALLETPSSAYFVSRVRSTAEISKLVAFGSREQNASIRAELDGVSRIHEGIQVFDQFDIDRDIFLERMDGASLVQYSGHSVLDGTNALMSSIQLDGNLNGPNAVTAMEIANRRLAPNAVVVLASCDSSVGNSTGGVGIRGLTSAFLIAGAGSVVGSLWPVETDSTREIVVRFHRSLKSGLSPAEALREARISFLRDFPDRSHPYYWAGFTVTGNLSALEPAPFVSGTATESAAPSR